MPVLILEGHNVINRRRSTYMRHLARERYAKEKKVQRGERTGKDTTQTAVVGDGNAHHDEMRPQKPKNKGN